MRQVITSLQERREDKPGEDVWGTLSNNRRLGWCVAVKEEGAESGKKHMYIETKSKSLTNECVDTNLTMTGFLIPTPFYPSSQSRRIFWWQKMWVYEALEKTSIWHVFPACPKSIFCCGHKLHIQTLFITTINNVILYCRKLFYESKFLCDTQFHKVVQIDVCSKQWNLSLWMKMMPWQTEKKYKNGIMTVMVKYRIMEDSWTIHKMTICHHEKFVL